MTNGFENLERRKLMTNTLGADGVLRIVGTAGDDTITVSLAGRTVSGITSTSKKHPLSISVSDGTTTQFFDGLSVREISFAGLAGDDKITLGKTNIRAYMNGGKGNDSLSASQGDVSDTLFGGAGNDYLFGGGGNDTLNGGDGGDLMIGGKGDDYLEVKSETDTDDTALGGDGTDTVSLQTYTTGTTENIGLLNPGVHVVTDTIYGDVERILGSAQADHITNVSGHTLYVDGGAGDDVILLGKGNDTIIGGPGRDSIDGGPGNDTIFAKDSAIDTVIGGTGHDTITRDSNDVT